MEDLDQSYGYVLYRTALDAGQGGELVLDGLHDYADVYVNQKLIGTLDRRLDQSKLMIPKLTTAGTLDILVENSGRVNFTKVIRTERKGLTGAVTIGGQTPRQWKIFSLPMNDLARLRFEPRPCYGPCFFRTAMEVDRPADTYLDTRAIHKGEVWVNGTMLGRAWSIGPQLTLYTPGPWLKRGRNELIFFDLQGSMSDALRSVTEPVFGETTAERN